MKYLFAGVFTVFLLVAILAVIYFTVRAIVRVIRNHNAKWEVHCIEKPSSVQVWLKKGTELRALVGTVHTNVLNYEDQLLYIQSHAEDMANARNSVNKVIGW